MPRSIEAWTQEIGRAGRDGLESDCVLLYSWADVIGCEKFLEEIEDPEVRAETRKKTTDMFRLADSRECRHVALARYFDEALPPCGTSCDVCRGAGIETLVAAARPRGLAKPARGSRAGTGTGGAFEAAFDRTVDAPSAGDAATFQRLRALRKRLADAEGVPAYIVFSDAVLRAMSERRPRTPEELLRVPGVGPVKLERYGAEFLRELGEAPA